jgi:23S rRNA (guanine2445-N2)-methyltransferase / 23S rRNA (guanine2069-N7)-methyltransferase
MRFFVQTAAGYSDLAAAEAQDAGAQHIQIVPGGIQFEGDHAAGYRFTLWTRISSRVLLELEPISVQRKTIEVRDKDSLYDAASQIPWSDHLGIDQTIAVTSTAKNANWLKNSQFASVRVKDSIVDHMRQAFGQRPDVEPDHPDILFHVHIEGRKAQFYLDFSGSALHRRGYRTHQKEAVLKETLAAAMVLRSRWKDKNTAYSLFLDPFCGMGTIPIEAALIAADIAPGLLNTDRFGFLAWKQHEPEQWELILKEAEQRKNAEHSIFPIEGWDIDQQSVEYANEHAKNAGVDHLITFRVQDFTKLEEEYTEKGLIVTDPPYGHRMGEIREVTRLYARIGEILPNQFPGWDASILCAGKDLMDELRLRPSNVSNMHNGPMLCSYARYEIFDKETRERLEKQAEEKKRQRLESPLSENALMCYNRLVKNKKQLKKYLSENNITSYRLYDADMPEYAAAVDIYEETYVHVQEYAPPATIPEERADMHLNELIDAVNRATGIEYEKIFIKQRRRQKGKNQYEKLASKKNMYIMRENGLRFLVNFTDYLDTGIFLDHRITRNLIKESSSKKRFLNLFSYTGTATVHAAAGGALSTVSVDASQTYLDWAKQNMELNGFSGMNHFYYKADCISWLKDSHDKYDLIFLDPPTFSNSKSRNKIFDIQKDHVFLIKLAMAHLTTEGTLIFSNNFRKFVMEPYVLNRYQVEEISSQTVPQDFSRNQKIHRCWKIRPKRVIRNTNKIQPKQKITIRKKKTD